jgi:exodeoxyribonuclease VII large subunit
MSRAPAQHIARHRGRLHQLLRELRASTRRNADAERLQVSRHATTLQRTAARAAEGDRARRGRELERLALALAAHDPQRTMARGYALVQDRAGVPLGSASAARDACDLTLRFHDGAVAAEVAGEKETE